jgi:hypothetical protein
MMLGSLNWLAPAAAQSVGPGGSPPTTEPTATTAPPTESPAPTETTAPVATETPIPTETAIPTEIVEPTPSPTEEPEGDFEAAAVSMLQMHFLVCEDTARVGQTDFLFSGEFAAAGTALDCAPPIAQFPGGVQVILTPLAGGPNIVFEFGVSDFYFWGGFEAGEYTVTAQDTATGGTVYSATMASTINLPDQSNTSLNVYYFIADPVIPDPPPGEGTAFLAGNLAYCIDPARDGQTDFFISDAFGAAAEASSCDYNVTVGQDSMTLTQVSGPVPYGPVTQSVAFGSFYFDEVPHGTYTLTNGSTGNVSEPFDLSYPWVGDPNAQVVNYYAAAPEPYPLVGVQKYLCGDADRAGEVDYLIIAMSDLFAADTCMVEPPTGEYTFTLRSTDGAYEQSLTVSALMNLVFFPEVTPGVYTIQEEDQPPSEPFTVTADSEIVILASNYVEPSAVEEPPSGTNPRQFFGAYVYCNSAERDGEVDFRIMTRFGGAATGECLYGEASPGSITITLYSDEAGTVEVDSQTVNGVDGSFYFFDLLPGYYRLSFQASTGATPAVSDVFSIHEDGFANGIIFIYQDVQAAPVLVDKEFCFDPSRDGETDFFIESALPIFDVEATSTITCRPANSGDEEIGLTLTNTGTGDALTTEIGEFSESSAFFGAVPAGTYTLTETSTTHTATSDPFSIELGGSGYTIFIRNYTSEPIETGFPVADVDLELWAFNCLNEARSGEFDYVFVPGESGGGESVSAAATEECDPSAEGEYAFVLVGGPVTGSGISAQATYQLTAIPGTPNAYVIDNGGSDVVPAGTYVIQETTTGFTSDPLVIDSVGNSASFYVYPAAPTPTPTDVPTETPLPTEPGATATPTDPGTTVTPTATEDGGLVGPGGDDDGTPDSEDPDDDNDGIPDAQDVTRLPSTGQGSDGGMNPVLLLGVSLLALLLLGAALRTGRRQHR